jgi:hypothetical protein
MIDRHHVHQGFLSLQLQSKLLPDGGYQIGSVVSGGCRPRVSIGSSEFR